MKKHKYNLPAACGLALFFTLCCMLVILIHINPGVTRYSHEPYPYSILQPDSVTEKETDSRAGIERTYTITIPEGSSTRIGAQICFYLRHTNVRFTLQDTALSYNSEELGKPHIGRTPGWYWVSIPVRENYGGKTLEITLTPVFRSVADEEPVFYMIGHEQLLTSILIPRESALILLSCIILLIGLYLCVLTLFMPLPWHDRYSLLLLGLISICSAIWKGTGLSSIHLVLEQSGIHKEIWYLGAVSYLSMLILSLRYLILSGESVGTRLGRWCYRAALWSAILFVLLQLFNIVELHDILIWYGLFISALHLIVLVAYRFSWREPFWCIPFFVSMGFDLLVYVINGTLNGSPFFLIWVTLSLISRGFGFVYKAIRREQILREKETELKDAKVQSMMQQIRPHFIYNTLTSIYVLCRDDPSQALKVIEDFTGYLQANFTAIAAKAPITFEDELRHTRAYLAVESMRFEDRLTVDFDIQYSTFRLPALTLQPIVENAVKYGAGIRQNQEHIVIRTRYEEGAAVITVQDDGPGFDPDTISEETHIGIENVRERLQLMCGGRLEIRSIPNLGTTIRIIIPSDSRMF